MTPERWQQVKAIFNSAINYRPEERGVFISQACSGDEDLRSEVESLIASHERSGEFIDEPAFAVAAGLLLDERSELKPGQTVGSYEILSFLSRGGMGEVYLAEDKRLGRKVALKVLPSSFTKDEDRLRRFEQEARAASALNHPNIITIFEIRQAGSSHVIATEFVEGETLRTRLYRSSLSLSEALDIAIQVADALSAAHKAGIIHRDVKPENIMLRPDGYVKVLDFGLAKLSEQAPLAAAAEGPTLQMQTGSGIVIGTAGYMSPEQARGQNVDARSDIFNLGAVIYEMVAGQKPFSGETPSDTLAAILTNEPEPLSRVAPNTPAELVRIVSKALRKNREERYQVVKDLLLDLRSLKQELDFQAKLKPESLTVERTHEKRRSLLVVGVVALLIAVTGVALYSFLKTRQSQTALAPKVLKTTQVTFSSGLDGFPSLSPDGKSVAYSSDQNGNFEIYVKQVSSGGGELQLTNDAQQNLYPSWSPDGQRIAYTSRKRGGIWVVSALGGTPRQLTETGAKPAWSPDGAFIAFQSELPGAELTNSRVMPPATIWIIPAQGGTAKRITQSGNPAGGHSTPSWSPNGKRILFEVSDFASATVWSIARDGSDVKKITIGTQPTFTADGRFVYFMTRGSGESELSRIQISAAGEPIGEPTIISQAGEGTSFSAPVVSADGKRILYGANRIVSTLSTVSLLPNGDAAGPPSVFAADTSSRNTLPRFSPDGTKIALNRWRRAIGNHIWIAGADGKNATQLTNSSGGEAQASWLPSGDKIVFLSDRESSHLRLWTVSTITGKQDFLLDLGEGVQFATLSPDGNQVAYNFMQNGVMNVWVANVSDRQRKQLTFDYELMGFPCWSPDGKMLAYEMKRGENAYLMLMPSDGGKSTQLTFAEGKSWPHSFSPDGDKIAFAGQRDGVWNIYWISTSGKNQKRLTNYAKLNSFVRYPSWSRNQIVYEYAETTGNLWMLELE